jgi:hypothetical protein
MIELGGEAVGEIRRGGCRGGRRGGGRGGKTDGGVAASPRSWAVSRWDGRDGVNRSMV